MYAAAANLYLETYFPEEAKNRTQMMIKNVTDALVMLIKRVSWLDPTWTKQAIESLERIKYRIGYDDFFVNMTYLKSSYRFVDRDLVKPETPFLTIQKMLRRNFDYFTMLRLESNQEAYNYRRGPFMTEIEYNLETNTLSCQAAALQGLFNEEEFPKTFRYGGLGSKLASLIVNALEKEHSLPGNYYFWAGNSSKDRSKAIKCTEMDKQKTKGKHELKITFSSFSALKAVFQAYVEDISTVQKDYVLPTNKTIGPLKLLFYSYGQKFCRGAGYGYSTFESEER
ncbi:unnamed protein product [Ixodes hexagonus]